MGRSRCQVEVGGLVRIVIVATPGATEAGRRSSSYQSGKTAMKTGKIDNAQRKNLTDSSIKFMYLPPEVLLAPKVEPAPKALLWLLDPNPPAPKPKDILSGWSQRL